MEPTRVEACTQVAKRVREAGDEIDATAILMEFFDYVKDAGYKQGRDDEAHALYHGAGVRT